MDTFGVVIPFPKLKKRGREVTRGPLACVVQFSTLESERLKEARRVLGSKYARIRKIVASFDKCGDPNLDAKLVDEVLIEIASGIQDARIRRGHPAL